jgi:hypothetical protein
VAERKPRSSPFGTVRDRKSKAPGAGKKPVAWQARYVGPDGKRYSATFATKGDAQAWLASARTDRDRGRWVAPGQVNTTANAPVTLSEYAALWLAERDLAARTRDH